MPKVSLFENKKEYMKHYRKVNAEKLALYNKEYSQKNKENIKENRQKRAVLKKQEITEVCNAWKEKNKDHIREYNKLYTSKRYASDPIFKLKINQRSRVRAILKNQKSLRTNDLLGCSFDELKNHIESMFLDGMSWDNMGQWHIDHIIPLAAFNLENEEAQKIAFNYKNLQPLWAIDNLKKGAKHG
jgi:hypothetical protein